MKRALPVLAVAFALCLPSAATGVVPPKNCGTKTIAGKRYQVKADQMSCKRGRRLAKRFIVRNRKPRGYKCRDFPSQRNRVDFYCSKERKIYFAIRR